jgi:hypothetical protein
MGMLAWVVILGAPALWLVLLNSPDLYVSLGLTAFKQSYLMMESLHQTVEFWWKDTNSSVISTDAHPVQSWQNCSGAAIPNVHPSTSLGYTTFFYAQEADTHHIRGYNISYNAENTTIIHGDDLAVGGTSGPVPGLPGTHMTVSAVPNQSGGAELYVFYQTVGNDVTLFKRDMKGGGWTQGPLPIPDK